MAVAAPLAFLSVFLYMASFFAESSFLYNGFSSLHLDREAALMQSRAGLRLDGAAAVMPSGTLRLTDASQNVVGHAFYPYAFQMFDKNSSSNQIASFSTSFVFAIQPSSPGQGGGHGFAFALAPSTKFEGAESGHYLGLFNPSNNGNKSNHIFAVKFDTVFGFDEANSRGNHVGIDINGVISSASAPAYDRYLKGDGTEIMLDSGDPIAVWIEYDGLNKIVNVTIGSLNELKPDSPLLSYQIDLTSILKEQMFVGFSASTGMKTSSHYILGWSFAVNARAQPLRYAWLPKLQQSHPPSSNPHLMVPPSSNPHSMVIIVVSSIVAVIGIVSLALLFRRIRKGESLEDWERDCPHRFNYKDLHTATNGFQDSHQIGSGGFGSVYRGLLRSTGAEIAVKRVKKNSSQGIKEFAAEIESLGHLRHKNLVNLQGWCKQNNDLLIVYEYIPNGSLHSLLYHKKQSFILNWDQRFNILKGIAAGLLYLHEDWEQVVIHRDVKPSNVLIDAGMNARLSDFGLSRQYDHDQISHTTRVVGTIGYMPPELFHTGKASKSADVFAYGVLLLEVASGRKPVGSNQIRLVDCVMEVYETGNVLHMADPKLDSVYKVEEMEMVLKLGILCTHWKPEARPSIRQVMKFLNGEETLPTFESSSGSIAEVFQTQSNGCSSMSIGLISTGSINVGR